MATVGRYEPSCGHLSCSTYQKKVSGIWPASRLKNVWRRQSISVGLRKMCSHLRQGFCTCGQWACTGCLVVMRKACAFGRRLLLAPRFGWAPTMMREARARVGMNCPRLIAERVALGCQSSRPRLGWLGLPRLTANHIGSVGLTSTHSRLLMVGHSWWELIDPQWLD